MTDLFIQEQYTSKVDKLNKQEMCNIINNVRGYAMTPDLWTREELINYLIDGGIYLSWLSGHKQTTTIFGSY
tara:strand:+ start:131 stop:346 length:216 start_codon:yes stop_codon:yes gene_type:complete